MHVFGAGVNDTFGSATVGFACTNSNFRNPTGNGYLGTPGAIVAPGATLNPLKFQNFELNAKYLVTPAFYVGGQYVYTLENYDASTGGVKPQVHTVGLMADYNVPKRTDFYVQGVYQKVAGDTSKSIMDNAFILGTQAPSSTSNQLAFRAAIHHKF